MPFCPEQGHLRLLAEARKDTPHIWWNRVSASTWFSFEKILLPGWFSWLLLCHWWWYFVTNDSFSCQVECCPVECGWYGGEEACEEEYSGAEVEWPESAAAEWEEEQVDQAEEYRYSVGCPE